MYNAKANGKNQFVFFTDEMQKGVLHRLDVESWLREALDTSQLRVYYQPVVSMSDRRVEAVEALVRWQHPNLGLLSPDDFLDVAEETGLIVPLGKFVLRDACRQIRIWRERYAETMMVSVNLSAAQLRDESIVEDVRLAMAADGVGPGALMVEVTEGALIGDVSGATAVLESLSALGVTIAIDDFGTGYSSLSHLQLFPVDVIKVDKAFVAGMCGTPARDARPVGARHRGRVQPAGGGRGHPLRGAACAARPPRLRLRTGLPVLPTPAGVTDRRAARGLPRLNVG